MHVFFFNTPCDLCPTISKHTTAKSSIEGDKSWVYFVFKTQRQIFYTLFPYDFFEEVGNW